MRASLTFLFCLISQSLVAQSCDELSVAGSDQWIPFAYTTGDNGSQKPAGIAYEVTKLIGKELGIPVKISVGIPWARIELMLGNGSLDMLAGNYWNQERAIKWIITESFAEDDVRVFVKKGRTFPFHELTDLIGKRGIMPRAVSFGQKFDAFKSNLNLESVQLHQQMIAMLQLDRTDYAILPLFSGISTIKHLGHHGEIIPLETPINVNTVHLSLSRESPCAKLTDKINQVIRKLKTDGTIQTITASYY